MKVDIFSHILPEKYLKNYSQRHKEVLKSTEARTRPVFDLGVRLRLMERYPDVLQVLALAHLLWRSSLYRMKLSN